MAEKYENKYNPPHPSSEGVVIEPLQLDPWTDHRATAAAIAESFGDPVPDLQPLPHNNVIELHPPAEATESISSSSSEVAS